MIVKISYNRKDKTPEYCSELDKKIRAALESNGFESHEQYITDNGIRHISFKVKEMEK
jgi:hypothetical protein